MGVLKPFLSDPYIEDISCDGVGPIFIEHKIFKGLKSVIEFKVSSELDEFVVKMAERIKRPITYRNPIVDATLPDGSRINIVYGTEISKHGSNFSIRKVNEVPLSILNIVESNGIDYLAAAYLWICVEYGMSLFVSGETASGKTTLLNAITTFIPPENKIITIEDTPELTVPHRNWIREVALAKGKGEGDGAGGEGSPCSISSRLPCVSVPTRSLSVRSEALRERRIWCDADRSPGDEHLPRGISGETYPASLRGPYQYPEDLRG